MEKNPEINLTDIPWPANILTCGRRLSELAPGGRLELVVDDPALKDHLVLLLGAMPDIAYEVKEKDGRFRFKMEKASDP